MRTLKVLIVILAITMLSGIAIAGDFSFTGTFTDVNQVQYFTFTVSSGSKVVIQSYSYAGGSNANGAVIARGGFDPTIALFQGTGPSAALFKTADDEFSCQHIGRDSVTNVCYDVYWEGTAQPADPNSTVQSFTPGTYTLAVLNYANFTNGATIADGFTGSGSGLTCAGNPRTFTPALFPDCGGAARDGHWALDIKGVDSVQLGNRPKLVVTAADASRTYGSANPAFSGTVTGVQAGDQITATFASATDATTAVGSYAIVPTLVDPAGKLSNYDVTINNGTLSISAAPLNVVPANASRFVGQANPTLAGTITGLQNGDNITATYSTTAVTLSPAGAYSINAALSDPGGKLGNYAVTSNAGTLTVLALTAPTPSAVLPASGSGLTQSFVFRFTDGAGAAHITGAAMLFNGSVNFYHGCGIWYSAGTVQLTDGVTSSAYTPLGSAATLSTDYCAVDLAHSSAAAAGNDLTITLAMTFKPAMSGVKNVYAKAVDWKANLASDYAQLGTWTPAAQATPVSAGVIPSGGAGTTQTFNFTFSDASGSSYLTGAALLFNTTATFFKGCGIWYSSAGIQLSDGVTATAFTPLGTNATLDSTNCSVNLASSSASASGNNLMLNLTITFKPGFAGTKNVYSKAVDWKNNLQSAYVQQGTWTVQ